MIKKVTLLEDSEHTILSRIRYPDLEGSRLIPETARNHSSAKNNNEKKVLTIGIASMARPSPTQNYLVNTVKGILNNLSGNEKKKVIILIAITDRNATLKAQRAKELQRDFPQAVQSGLLVVVSPPLNIYPFENKNEMASRLPYGNSVTKSRWQTKLSLDFAYLFSCAFQLPSDFFINLEDDVEPTEEEFYSKVIQFVHEQNQLTPEWNSLIFSNWLSIGRLYRTVDLVKLVDLILIAYRKQPVDFIMHHFDAIQMADRFREIRRKPPLLEHVGRVSTLDHLQELAGSTAKMAQKLNKLKRMNPPASLATNITTWQNFNVNASYFAQNASSGPTYFWGKQFRMYDVIDVHLHQPSDIRSVRVASGFPRSDARAGQDRITNCRLLLARDPFCEDFLEVPSLKMIANQGTLHFTSKTLDSNDKELAKNVNCVRIQVLEGQSDWLLVSLIHIKVVGH